MISSSTNSATIRKAVPKILGLATTTEETEVISKAYLQAQLTRSQEILKRKMKPEFMDTRSEISQLKSSINNLFEVMRRISTTPAIIYNDHNKIWEEWQLLRDSYSSS